MLDHFGDRLVMDGVNVGGLERFPAIVRGSLMPRDFNARRGADGQVMDRMTSAEMGSSASLASRLANADEATEECSPIVASMVSDSQ